MFFKDTASRWLTDLQPRATARTYMESKHRVAVLNAYLGELSHVSQDDVRRLITGRSGCSRATRNGDLKTLRAILNWGRKQGYLSRVPEVKLLPAPKKVPRTLPRDGIKRLLQVSEGRVRMFILLARFTLARHSELLGIKYEDVNFETGAVVIRAPKGHRQRVLFVPTAVLDELKIYRGCQVYSEPEDYLFQSEKRRRKPVGTLHKPLRDVFKRAGLYTPGMQTTHALRHSGASELIRTTDIYTVSQILGHQSIETTLVYLHCSDERKRKAAESLDY